MKNINKTFLLVGITALLAIGTVVLLKGHHTETAHMKDIYYCPMHPSIVSDKPGECSICHMRLVKREGSIAAVPYDKLENICVLHNCSKAHDGKPCPMLVIAKKGELSVFCPICGAHVIDNKPAKAKKILYWTDPMIPGYKSDKPGKSPMGMDMVPVYEGDNEPPSQAGSPDGYSAVLLTAQKQQLIGVKSSKVAKRHLIKTIRTAGTIAHDPELYQAQAEYIQAIQSFKRSQESNIPEIIDQANHLVESTKIRLKHMGLSDAMIAETAAMDQPEHSLLFAHPGEPVWMYAQIYEYELPLVKTEQEIKVEVPSSTGEIFTGKIRAIDPMVDPTTRTTRVRAQVADPQGRLKPDMYVNASIEVDLGETLEIPVEAVFDTGTKKIVFVDKGNGLFEPRDVMVGTKADQFYELKSGVSEGETVVTSGNFLIDSESRLKAALDDYNPPSGDQQNPATSSGAANPHAGHGGQ